MVHSNILEIYVIGWPPAFVIQSNLHCNSNQSVSLCSVIIFVWINKSQLHQLLITKLLIKLWLSINTAIISSSCRYLFSFVGWIRCHQGPLRSSSTASGPRSPRRRTSCAVPWRLQQFRQVAMAPVEITSVVSLLMVGKCHQVRITMPWMNIDDHRWS